jgi:hypothetical protein
MVDVFENLKEEMFAISSDKKLLSKPVQVRARVLTTKEAIGNPEADDFPLENESEKQFQTSGVCVHRECRVTPLGAG